MTSMEEYQAIPALSAGGAWILSEMCPALYWAQSPFNPQRLPGKHTEEFNVGTAAHLAVLEPDLYSARVCHIPFDTYHKAKARGLRDAAYADGQTPLKPSEVAIVDGVRDAIERRDDVARLFRGGRVEVTVQWTMDDVPCKCRPDFVTETGGYILDLKTVACAHPRAASMAALRDGWHVRVPWYRLGLATERPLKNPLSYLFVCVEKTPPHLIEVYELDKRSIEWGNQIMRRAMRLFRLCLENNYWPGYDERIPVTLMLPSYAEYQLADREAEGDFSEPRLAIRRGMDYLAP